jgi:hypothetical protein
MGLVERAFSMLVPSLQTVITVSRIFSSGWDNVREQSSPIKSTFPEEKKGTRSIYALKEVKAKLKVLVQE